MEDKLGSGSISRLLVELSIPAILGMITAAIYNFVDRIFVGRINPLGLTAIGITMPVQIVQMAVVLMVGVGASTLISIACGNKDYERAQKLLDAAYLYFFVAQLAITILGILFLKPIFSLLGISAEVFPYARNYTVIILAGGIPGLMGYCLNNSVRALGQARKAMQYVVISSLLNIALDWLMVWILGWGVSGAALATILSESLVTVFVLHFFRKNPIYAEARGGLVRDPGELLFHVREITANGIPSFLMQAFATVINIILNRFIVSYGGDLQLASMTIISSVSQLFLMVVYGIGQGAQPIFGFNFGAEKFDRTRKALDISIAFVLSFMVLVFFILQVSPGFFVRLFVKDRDLIAMTIHNMRIYLCMIPLTAVHSIATTFLQSIRQPRYASLLYILRFGGILVPALLILPRLFGIDGVYMANAVSEGVSGLAALVILLGFRRLDRRRASA